MHSIGSQAELVAPLIPFVGEKEASQAKQAYIDSGHLTLRAGITIASDPETLWSPEQSRSFGRMTHGWFFLRGFFTNFEDLPIEYHEGFVELLGRLLTSWQTYATSESMAYHDETTAQRVMNWVAVAVVADNILDEKSMTSLSELIEHDLAVLADPNFYAGANNHGMFQDFAILVAVTCGFRVPDSTDLIQLAMSRLDRYLSSCFTRDGIHVENSPSYHLMVSGYLKKTIEVAENLGYQDLLEHLKPVLEGADIYTAFSIAPTGKFVPISDTSPIGT